MPLLTKSKAFIYIHPRPVLAQVLGVFYHQDHPPDWSQIDTYIRRKFVLFQYPLPVHHSTSTLLKRNKQLNFILPLNAVYEDLYRNFRRDRKARIRQSNREKLLIENCQDPDDLLRLFTKYVSGKIIGGVDPATIDKMRKIISGSLEQRDGFLYKIRGNNAEPLAVAFFIKFRKRLIYMYNASSQEGRRKNATTAILNEVIRAHSGSDLILDFEGSPVKGIADFYASFGAQTETYELIEHRSVLAKLYLKFRKLFLLT
ncbi:MAG: hypothetical protein AAF519_15625 [Bacteroidota bacterium]